MSRVQRVGEWVHAQVGTDRVMMNVSSGSYLGLTSVGARIWDLLERVTTLDGICDELVRQYDVERETCRAEVQAFLAELANAGALAIHSTD